MARQKLPTKRGSVNMQLPHTMTNGKTVNLLVTFGYDAEHNVKEVFCADFKAGTDLHHLIQDACILLSRLLQHGDLPMELVASMCSPLSLIGTIARGIVKEQGDG